MSLSSQQIIRCLSLLLLTSLASGCATFQLPFGKKIPTATAKDPAVQILCLWQHGEGNDPDGYPCKGFQGQILFLSSQASTPIRVDGDVRIYLFDDQGTLEEQAKPLRLFNFDSGSWDIHLTNSALGPTYSVFVPYVRRGIPDANCSLRVRLKPKHGPIVFSDFSTMQLNGNRKRPANEPAKPITPDESERDLMDSITEKLRKTTTISMGGNPKSSESIHNSNVVPKVTANSIQQASFETSQPTNNPQSATNDAERIRRLEAMVEQLSAEKQRSTSTEDTKPPQRLTRDQATPPQELPSPPRRKLRSSDGIPKEPVDDRPSHPLDDDSAPVRRMPQTSARQHPLLKDDEADRELESISSNSTDLTRYRRGYQ